MRFGERAAVFGRAWTEVRTRVPRNAFIIHPPLHMSSAPPPNNQPTSPEKQPEAPSSSQPASAPDAAMDTAPDVPEEESWADIPEEILSLTTDEILTRIRLLDNDIKVRGLCRRPDSK